MGKACKGEEKVKRLEEYYRNRKFTLTEAYSDKPEELFEFTQKPYLVKKGKLKPIRNGH